MLDSYSLLFVTSTQGVPGDGDWSTATTITFPPGTTLAVRTPRRTAGARRACWRAPRRRCVPLLRANTRHSAEP